jgi:hypothetical protein
MKIRILREDREPMLAGVGPDLVRPLQADEANMGGIRVLASEAPDESVREVLIQQELQAGA